MSEGRVEPVATRKAADQQVHQGVSGIRCTTNILGSHNQCRRRSVHTAPSA